MSDLRWCREDGGIAAARARVLLVALFPRRRCKDEEQRSKEADAHSEADWRLGGAGRLQEKRRRQRHGAAAGAEEGVAGGVSGPLWGTASALSTAGGLEAEFLRIFTALRPRRDRGIWTRGKDEEV